MEPNQRELKAMQGLSVFAMVCLHLFCRYDYDGLYTPLIILLGYPLCFYLGQAADFCVTGFAFCSGYALAAQLSRPVTPP